MYLQLQHCRSWSSLVLVLLCVGTLSGQRITFSVDVQGPTAGLFGSDGSILDSFYNNEIDGADILTTGVPTQPIPPNPNLAALGPVNDSPGILVFGINQNVPNSRTLKLAPTLIGTRPEPEAEVDALSFGHDLGLAIFFSVDEFSTGIAGDVQQQSLLGQVSADIFRGLPTGLQANALVIDGLGGERPNHALGLGLIEPNPPLPGVPDDGDNLDALDINTQPGDLNGPIFFSLNASFNELVEQGGAGEIPNIGSAQQNQVSPADILVAFPDEGPRLYLSAQRLGLHPLFDDVDALALFDADQDGEFDEQIDQVFFSVRRGSQIVGQLDSALGIPIAPGDILTLPGPPTDFSQPFPPPEVVVLAEDLGLLADRIPFGDVLLTTENRVAAIADPLPDDLDALSLGIQDGDMNCNFRWDSGDVSAFKLALESAGLYESQFGLICSGNAALHGDVSMDGRFDFQDIEDFKRIMSNAGTLSAAQVEAMFAATVPEPANRLAFFFIALLQILTWQRNHRT